MASDILVYYNNTLEYMLDPLAYIIQDKNTLMKLLQDME